MQNQRQRLSNRFGALSSWAAQANPGKNIPVRSDKIFGSRSIVPTETAKSTVGESIAHGQSRLIPRFLFLQMHTAPRIQAAIAIARNYLLSFSSATTLPILVLLWITSNNKDAVNCQTNFPGKKSFEHQIQIF